ncbi:hypothetical protein NP233_g5966 [Leucocoprinus birnbaumii]|uniref:F-box domain-containing protein n=1 Tax=Leucocoprinus birnbaumii TaxID=56174 RepID=A0AAD5YVZ3_9AGAR|nr:hypothetical protein NP233_g5966 [Leucocoprinus birnbaumii]
MVSQDLNVPSLSPQAVLIPANEWNAPGDNLGEPARMWNEPLELQRISSEWAIHQVYYSENSSSQVHMTGSKADHRRGLNFPERPRAPSVVDRSEDMDVYTREEIMGISRGESDVMMSEDGVGKVNLTRMRLINQLYGIDDALDEDRRDLECLERQIEALKDKMSRKGKERESVEQMVSAIDSLASAWRRLPSELLQLIFVYCLPPQDEARCTRDNAPILLTRICITWYKLVKALPCMWSTIILAPQRLEDRPFPRPRGFGLANAYFMSCISLSRMLPIQLYLHSRFLSHPATLELIESASERISTLSIVHNVLCFTDEGRPLKRLLLPNLMNFEIRLSHYCRATYDLPEICVGDMVFFQDLLESSTRLEAILWNDHLGSCSRVPAPLYSWRNLHTLHVANPIDTRFIFFVFREIPLLQQFSCHNLLHDLPPYLSQNPDLHSKLYSPEPTSPLIASKLKMLSISHQRLDSMSRIFQFLTTPALCALVVTCTGGSMFESSDVWSQGDFVNFLNRSQCRLEYLQLAFQPIGPLWFAEILHLHACRDTLRDLVIWTCDLFIDEAVCDLLTLRQLHNTVASVVIDGQTAVDHALCPNLRSLAINSTVPSEILGKFITMIYSRPELQLFHSAASEDEHVTATLNNLLSDGLLWVETSGGFSQRLGIDQRKLLSHLVSEGVEFVSFDATHGIWVPEGDRLLGTLEPRSQCRISVLLKSPILFPILVFLLEIRRLWPTRYWLTIMEIPWLTFELIGSFVFLFEGIGAEDPSNVDRDPIYMTSIMLLTALFGISLIITIWDIVIERCRDIFEPYDGLEVRKGTRWKIILGGDIFKRRFSNDNSYIQSIRGVLALLLVLSITVLSVYLLFLLPFQGRGLIKYDSLKYPDVFPSNAQNFKLDELILEIHTSGSGNKDYDTWLDVNAASAALHVNMTGTVPGQNNTWTCSPTYDFVRCTPATSSWSLNDVTSLQIDFSFDFSEEPLPVIASLYGKTPSTPPKPPLLVNVIFEDNDRVTSWKYGETIYVFPGSRFHVVADVSWKEKQRDFDPESLGLTSFSKNAYPTVTAVHTFPMAQTPGSAPINDSIVGTFQMLFSGKYLDRLEKEYGRHDFWAGFATVGGVWTAVNGVFAGIFGSTLLLVLFDRKPLSAYGLIHAFRGGARLYLDESNGRLSPEKQSEVLELLRNHLLDTGEIDDDVKGKSMPMDDPIRGHAIGSESEVLLIPNGHELLPISRTSTTAAGEGGDTK